VSAPTGVSAAAPADSLTVLSEARWDRASYTEPCFWMCIFGYPTLADRNRRGNSRTVSSAGLTDSSSESSDDIDTKVSTWFEYRIYYDRTLVRTPDQPCGRVRWIR
jgi:hypothetical protein